MDQIEKLREVQSQVETASQKVLQDTLTEGMEAALEAFRVTGNPKFPDEYMPAIEAAMRFMWTRSVKGSAGVIIEQFKEDLPLETKQDEELLFDQILREFIEAYGARRVQQIFEATREQIMQMIATGQRRGLTLPEISRGIREAIPQISRTRAAVIARTETHTSSMYASQQVARTSRRPLVKKWVAVEDPRTRDFGEGDGEIDEFSHRAVDGQERPLDQPYAVPSKYGMSEPLMFPGDPNGSAGNVINCRCAEIYERPQQ